MKTLIVISGAMLILAGQSTARPQAWPAPIAERLVKLTHRFVHCSAVFSVMAFEMEQQGDPHQTGVIKRYMQRGDYMWEKAATISSEIGQQREAVRARWEKSAKGLLAEMDSRSRNAPDLQSKDLDRCVALYTDATRHIRAAILGR